MFLFHPDLVKLHEIRKAENGTPGEQTHRHRPVKFQKTPKVPLYLKFQSYK